MRQSILITGASGFLGSRVLPQLTADHANVVSLGRRKPAAARPEFFVQADFTDREACRKALEGCRTVVHLAAVTGKRPPAEYFRVNRDGTATLLRQAQAAGVERFLFVSTIAARFDTGFRYHYADSKREAEALVRESGMKWTIVRPTMMFGPGSPVQAGLMRMASLPVIPVFGDGRTPVQPIHVEDAASIIGRILESEDFQSRTVEIGGPEAIGIEPLLFRMRRAAGLAAGRAVHLPAGLVAASLAAVEPVLRPVLPLTAGQLSTFMNPGDARPDPGIDRWKSGLRRIDEMLR